MTKGDRKRDLREQQAEAIDALPADLARLELLIGSVGELVRGAGGCRHDLSATEECAREYGLAWDTLLPWLHATGGYCDCEVVLHSGARLAEISDWIEQRRRFN